MEEQTSLIREAKQRRPLVEPLAGPPSDSPLMVLALIERVALDPGADVEKLDRLAAMYERLRAPFGGCERRPTRCCVQASQSGSNRPSSAAIDAGSGLRR